MLYTQQSDGSYCPPSFCGGRFGRRGRRRGSTFASYRNCKPCGSKRHTIADSEATKLEEQIRDLQVQLSKFKTSHSTSYVSIDVLPDEESVYEDTEAALNACMSAFTDEETGVPRRRRKFPRYRHFPPAHGKISFFNQLYSDSSRSGSSCSKQP